MKTISSFLRKHRGWMRKLMLAAFMICLFLPLCTVKSCASQGGMSEKNPVTYSWIGIVVRDGKFDTVASAMLLIAVILIGISFVRPRVRILPLFAAVAEFLLGMIAVALMIYWPGIAFLFDTVSYTPIFYLMLGLLAMTVFDSAWRSVEAWSGIRAAKTPDGAKIGMPLQLMRILNIVQTLPWLVLPLMGKGSSTPNVGDIIAMLFYLLFLWTPYFIMGLTANIALRRRERWAYVWTALASVLSIAVVLLLSMEQK